MKERIPRMLKLGWTSEALSYLKPRDLYKVSGWHLNNKKKFKLYPEHSKNANVPFFFLTFRPVFFIRWPGCPSFPRISPVLALKMLPLGRPEQLVHILLAFYHPASHWEVQACRQGWYYFFRKQASFFKKNLRLPCFTSIVFGFIDNFIIFKGFCRYYLV